MARVQLTADQVGLAINITIDKMWSRLQEKGYGTQSSTHEILGIITEEYKELIDAVQSNNADDVLKELLDIAVGCIFGITSIQSKTIDW